MVDLGTWMLLRFVPDTSMSRPAWIALSRRQCEALWSPCRAALLSRRPGEGANPAADPS